MLLLRIHKYLFTYLLNTCSTSNCAYGASQTYANLFMPINYVTNSKRIRSRLTKHEPAHNNNLLTSKLF